MKVEILKSDKEDLELSFDNATIAELLRVYLNSGGVKFAAWRKDHPSKPLLMKIQTSGKTAKKSINEAFLAVRKDTEKILKALKK